MQAATRWTRTSAGPPPRVAQGRRLTPAPGWRRLAAGVSASDACRRVGSHDLDATAPARELDELVAPDADLALPRPRPPPAGRGGVDQVAANSSSWAAIGPGTPDTPRSRNTRSASGRRAAAPERGAACAAPGSTGTPDPPRRRASPPSARRAPGRAGPATCRRAPRPRRAARRWASRSARCCSTIASSSSSTPPEVVVDGPGVAEAGRRVRLGERHPVDAALGEQALGRLEESLPGAEDVVV